MNHVAESAVMWVTVDLFAPLDCAYVVHKVTQQPQTWRQVQVQTLRICFLKPEKNEDRVYNDVVTLISANNIISA